MELATLPAPAKVNLAAMTAAIIGILLQIAAGVDYPPVPPGPIILAVAVGLVVITHRRWALVVAVAVPLFLTVGGTIAFLAAADDMALRHPDDLGAFLATLLQMAAVVVAVAAGLRALRDDPT